MCRESEVDGVEAAPRSCSGAHDRLRAGSPHLEALGSVGQDQSLTAGTSSSSAISTVALAGAPRQRAGSRDNLRADDVRRFHVAISDGITWMTALYARPWSQRRSGWFVISAIRSCAVIASCTVMRAVVRIACRCTDRPVFPGAYVAQRPQPDREDRLRVPSSDNVFGALAGEPMVVSGDR
jgi:hypothetical protein